MCLSSAHESVLPEVLPCLPVQKHQKQKQKSISRDGTLVGYTFSKRYKKVSPHRKSHNLLYNLLREKNKPSPEMVNKRGVPIGPTWLTKTLDSEEHSEKRKMKKKSEGKRNWMRWPKPKRLNWKRPRKWPIKIKAKAMEHFGGTTVFMPVGNRFEFSSQK